MVCYEKINFQEEKMLFNTWLQLWLTNYVKPSVKTRTVERYAQIVRTHIAETIGDKEIEELTPIVLQSYISELLQSGNKKTGKGLSANTTNAVISVIQSSLKTAHALGFVGTYAASMLRRPRIVEKKVECFSLIEQKKIENAVLSSKKTKSFGVLLCLYTGLRIGELLALKWSDIDLLKGILTVSHSCHDSNCGLIFDTPKTDTSRRMIPLPKQLLPIIKRIKKNADSEFVVSHNGKPVAVRSYQRSFELLLKKLHIAHRGFHSLRHTFATRALECGMDVKTLSELLGHKNPTITLNRYAHSLMEHKQDMMNKLGKLL